MEVGYSVAVVTEPEQVIRETNMTADEWMAAGGEPSLIIKP
jgi:hypothetical protein